MNVLILFVALGLSPKLDTITDSVDLVEVNYKYEKDTGKLDFIQLIFYDWDWCMVKKKGDKEAKKTWGHRAIGWRIIRETSNWGKEPASYERVGQRWRVTFFANGEIRRVHTTSLERSWTMFDPEVLEREKHPSFRRRDLAKRQLTKRAAAMLKQLETDNPPNPDGE